MRCLKDRSLLNVNDCLEGEHNAAIGVFLQALIKLNKCETFFINDRNN